MHEVVTQQHPVTRELQAMLRGVRWTVTPIDAAQIRAEERYRQERESFVHSKQNKDWVKQYSCEYGIVCCHFATVIGWMKWAAVENFFDWVEWGGSPPHYASKLKSCLAYRGGIRLEWTDRFDLLDKPGRFIVIPTACIPDGAIDSRLQAYEEQSKLPLRIRLKEVDVETICQGFEKYAKPIRSHNESDEEFEFRLLQTFVKIFDYTKLEKKS